MRLVSDLEVGSSSTITSRSPSSISTQFSGGGFWNKSERIDKNEALSMSDKSGTAMPLPTKSVKVGPLYEQRSVLRFFGGGLDVRP